MPSAPAKTPPQPRRKDKPTSFLDLYDRGEGDPDAPFTEADLQEMQNDPRYWLRPDRGFQRLVEEAYTLLYPGEAVPDPAGNGPEKTARVSRADVLRAADTTPPGPNARGANAPRPNAQPTLLTAQMAGSAPTAAPVDLLPDITVPPIPVGQVAGAAGRIARAASPAAAAAQIALTPRNGVVEGYADAERTVRYRYAPGDLHAVLERRDPATGAWKPAGRLQVADGPNDSGRLLGQILARKLDFEALEPGELQQPLIDPPTAITPPQLVNRPPERMGQDPVPGTLPQPERPEPLIFEALPDRDFRELILHANPGNPWTREQNTRLANEIVRIGREMGLTLVIVNGGFNEHGVYRGEKYLPAKPPLQAGRDRRVNSSYPDIAIEDETNGRWIYINTTDMEASGNLTRRERRQVEKMMINKETGDLFTTVPKAKKGADLNEHFKDHLARIRQALRT